MNNQHRTLLFSLVALAGIVGTATTTAQTSRPALLLLAAADKHDHDEAGHDHDDASHDHDDASHDHDDASHDHDDHGHGHGDDHALATDIDHAMAADVGITTLVANGGKLFERLISYGRLTTAPEHLSHVRARYTGLIKAVNPRIGDRVTQGDLLARVESDTSLKSYPILAPISGTVIQRHANVGEITQDQILFTIANFDTLWAELRIYPAQQSQVTAGQAVDIVLNGQTVSGQIAHLLPALNAPYQIARVAINNAEERWSPGMLVEGNILVNTHEVALKVEKSAVQSLEGQTGVFVKGGTTYTFAPLAFGRSDAKAVEVLSGLAKGQPYVSANSYLIKADIEKSAAEHVH